MVINSIGRFMVVLALMFLAGCAAVGPNYVPPETAAPGVWYTELKDGLIAQKANPETLANWWKTLNDPILSELIKRAVAGNLDLKKARARVREARAHRNISQAPLFPIIDVAGAATRNRISQERSNLVDYDLYKAGFDASWELDVFGGVRRSLEAATASLQASQEDLRDALVSLLSEVALNYLDVRTFQTGLAVAQANLEAQANTHQFTQSRFEAGLTNELAVQQAKYNMENTRSKIPILRIGLQRAMNRLSVLLGQQPGTLHAELQEPRAIPVTPLEVAVGVPAEALRRRPDVRRAERQLAAQTAQVGVATADLYPKFRLLGSIGLESLSLGDFFSASGLAYLIGPRITWPLFNAGAIRSNIEVQSTLQEQALIQYESTVLKALEEVENALVAYAEEQNRRQALKASSKAAQRAVALAESQYQAGLTDFTGILDAQRSLLSFQEQLAQSEGAVTSNLVRLYKALGGGWTSFVKGTGNSQAGQ
jgi:NodT family efflux transporter outer membrane factor (OMF) lipoprotein